MFRVASVPGLPRVLICGGGDNAANQNAHVTGKAWDRGYVSRVPTAPSLSWVSPISPKTARCSAVKPMPSNSGPRQRNKTMRDIIRRNVACNYYYLDPADRAHAHIA